MTTNRESAASMTSPTHERAPIRNQLIEAQEQQQSMTTHHQSAQEEPCG